MKKFLFKVSIFLAYALLWHTVFPVYVDPFNVFHVDNVRANGIMINKNYVKMNYILKNPNKFDTFLFGSSMMGAIHNDRIQGENTYNMLYSTGIPGWFLWSLKTMLAHNIYPRKIYLGISYGSIQDEATYKAQI